MLALLIISAFTVIFWTSCSKNDVSYNVPDVPNLLEERNHNSVTEFYALSNNNVLSEHSIFYSKELYAVAISGLANSEKMLAIDFRPATGQLYGVSDASKIYVINTITGKATAMSDTPFTPAIDGKNVGFDFNPTVDRIRLVTSTDQDLRLNPETGLVVAIDGTINPSDAEITSVAYSDSYAGTTITTLYDIDTKTDMLFMQTPPNAGTLVAVGPLGINAEGETGFDISYNNGLALATLGNNFYRIDLATGTASLIGPSKQNTIGVAIPTAAVAYAVDTMDNLLIFNPFTRSAIINKKLSGLVAGDHLVGIDMRPATGQLYGLGKSSRIYTINMSNGASVALGTGPFSPALQGTSFGFDFNPTVDRIRVVSNTGQNLRLHPVTGLVAVVDPSLNPESPMVDAVAYTNSFAGATTTTLYDIDIKTNTLYKQDPANAGTLVKVGYLGYPFAFGNGFDIGGQSNKGYAISDFYSNRYVYSINLNVGLPNILRDFPEKVNGFAIGLGF